MKPIRITEHYLAVSNWIRLIWDRKTTYKWNWYKYGSDNNIYFDASEYSVSIPQEIRDLPWVEWRNNTDHITDYFEKDSLTIKKDKNKDLYNMLLEFVQKLN